MQRIINALGNVRVLSTCLATYATVFNLICTGNPIEFWSNYFAGAATAMAMFMWLEEE